jgi:type I restriction enzyme S subunit
MNPPQTAPLEEVAEHVTVAYVGPTSEFFRDTGIPYLRTGNVGAGRLLFDDLRYVTEAFHRKNQKSALKAGDVLVTRVISDEINCGIVPAELGEANCGNVIAIRPGDKLVPNYLIHLIRSPEVQRLLIQRRVGSAQSVVNTSVLKSWKVPLLSVGVQRRIAEVLDRAEALRAKRRAALAQLDTLTQSIFLDLFGDPATNPKGWPVSTIGEVADVQGGLQVTSARKSCPREVPYLRVANVYRGYLDLSEIKTIRATDAEIARTTLEKNDLLVVEGHGNPAEIGRGALWNGSIAGCVHQNHIIRARFRAGKIVPLYVCEYFNSPGGRRHLLRAGKTTSGLNTISVSDVRGTPVALPPLGLQSQFANRIAAVDKLKSAHRASLAKLDALFASLQHRAFRGEL